MAAAERCESRPLAEAPGHARTLPAALRMRLAGETGASALTARAQLLLRLPRDPPFFDGTLAPSRRA